MVISMAGEVGLGLGLRYPRTPDRAVSLMRPLCARIDVVMYFR